KANTTTEKFIVILDKNVRDNHFNILSTCLGRKIKNFDPFAISQEESNKDENKILAFYFDSFTVYFGNFDPDFAMNELKGVEGVQHVEKSFKVVLNSCIITPTLKKANITQSKTSLYNLDHIDTANRKYDGFYTYLTNA
ncbi:1163_t:CDS:2, partial [Dentiscutata erythropus]